MCNCGKKRTGISQQPNTVNKNYFSATQPTTTSSLKTPVQFKYTGKTALTVTGNITRKNYRFNFTGDIQTIDFNDASSLMSIPVLRRIS